VVWLLLLTLMVRVAQPDSLAVLTTVEISLERPLGLDETVAALFLGVLGAGGHGRMSCDAV
jgi:hypothetical protein